MKSELRLTGWIQQLDESKYGARRHGRGVVGSPQSEVELRNRLNELHTASKLLATVGTSTPAPRAPLPDPLSCSIFTSAHAHPLLVYSPASLPCALQESELVLGVLRKHFMFSRMGAPQLMQLITNVEKMNTVIEEAVVSQGDDNAEHFYIVNSGEYLVEVTKVAGEDPITVSACPAVHTVTHRPTFLPRRHPTL
jgi:hypothetical protein